MLIFNELILYTMKIGCVLKFVIKNDIIMVSIIMVCDVLNVEFLGIFFSCDETKSMHGIKYIVLSFLQT